MNTRSAYHSFPLNLAALHSQQLSSIKAVVGAYAMALALVAVFLPVVLLVGVGVSAFVFELTRTVALVGPYGLAATALIAMTGLVVRKGMA